MKIATVKKKTTVHQNPRRLPNEERKIADDGADTMLEKKMSIPSLFEVATLGVLMKIEDQLVKQQDAVDHTRLERVNGAHHVPKTKEGEQTFLILTIYSHKFFKDNVTSVRPILNGVEFVWKPQLTKTEEQSRLILMRGHVLKFSQVGTDIELHEVTSKFRAGAVLGQKSQEGLSLNLSYWLSWKITQVRHKCRGYELEK